MQLNHSLCHGSVVSYASVMQNMICIMHLHVGLISKGSCSLHSFSAAYHGRKTYYKLLNVEILINCAEITSFGQ